MSFPITITVDEKWIAELLKRIDKYEMFKDRTQKITEWVKTTKNVQESIAKGVADQTVVEDWCAKNNSKLVKNKDLIYEENTGFSKCPSLWIKPYDGYGINKVESGVCPSHAQCKKCRLCIDPSNGCWKTPKGNLYCSKCKTKSKLSFIPVDSPKISAQIIETTEKKECWVLKETLYSCGEGSDGSAVECVAFSKDVLLNHVEKNYMFQKGDETEDFRYIEKSREDAIRCLDEGKCVGVVWMHGTNSLEIETCTFLDNTIVVSRENPNKKNQIKEKIRKLEIGKLKRIAAENGLATSSDKEKILKTLGNYLDTHGKFKRDI